MTFDTSVPKIEITETGPVAPEPEDILEGVLEDVNASMGGNLNIEQLSTPQGVFSQSQSAVTLDKDNVIVELMKNVNPDTSEGVMQDAIGRIYLMTRIASQPTVVTCACGGISGTLIPAFSKVQAQNNAIYISQSSAIIGVLGTIDVIFQAEIDGPTEAPVGTVNKIYQQIDGWDTVINAAAGVVGRDVENRAEFEFRRKNSIALNATGSLPAVRANVLAVGNVIDARTDENVTDNALIVGGVSLEPHSLYVAVVGGDDDEIAQAIWDRKGVGCDTNGATLIVVQDTENYDPPYPDYLIKFQRPTNIRIIFVVNVADLPSTPANYEDLVRSAILEDFNGFDGSLRARIGDTIFALDYLTSIQDAGPIIVSSMAVARYGDTPAEFAELNIDEYPTLDELDITVNLV